MLKTLVFSSYHKYRTSIQETERLPHRYLKFKTSLDTTIRALPRIPDIISTQSILGSIRKYTPTLHKLHSKSDSREFRGVLTLGLPSALRLLVLVSLPWPSYPYTINQSI